MQGDCRQQGQQKCDLSIEDAQNKTTDINTCTLKGVPGNISAFNSDECEDTKIKDEDEVKYSSVNDDVAGGNTQEIRMASVLQDL